MSERSILHVDMDAFFASVEVLDDPSLRGRPVIVGGDPETRGVVAAASYEARRFGVHSAMSAARARRLCPDGVFLHPRGRRYAEISRRVFALFREYTPLVEPLSIDEAFLDVTGCRRLFGPGEKVGREIKRRIRDEVGLVASVGVAPNKFLAKLASDLEKPDGFVVVPADGVAEFLAPLPVGRLWGVGPRTEAALASLGVRSVAELRACPAARLRARLGEALAAHLAALALGLDERPVVTGHDARSIGHEITFARDVGDPAALRAELDGLVEKTVLRLRDQGLAARTVHLKARFPDFSTVTRSATLPAATDARRLIRDTARDLLDHRLERRGSPLRLIGVSLSQLEAAGGGQADLFGDPGEERDGRIDSVLDDAAHRFGAGVVRRGALRATGGGRGPGGGPDESDGRS